MGRGAHYPPEAGCGVVKEILIVWHACSFLASSILFRLLNLFHTDSVLLRNLSQCFAFCQMCILTIRTRATVIRMRWLCARPSGLSLPLGSLFGRPAFPSHLRLDLGLTLLTATLPAPDRPPSRATS